MPRIKQDPDVLGYDSVFPFGKYEGEYVSDVLIENPSYIEWVIQNTAWEFDEEVMQEL